MTARSKSLACGVLATALVAGCGGSKAGAPIPRASADDLTSRLKEARNRSTPLRCNDLRRDTLPVLENDAQNLPQNVDQKVRTTVSDGIAHLRDLVQQQCDAEHQQRLQQQQQTSTTEVAPTPQPSTAQPTLPPSTEQTPPPSATTPPSTSRSTPPPSAPNPSGGGITPPSGQGDGGGGNASPPGRGGGAGGALGGGR